MSDFRAGSASLPLDPPLGLPMVGFIRQPWNANGYGLPLEVGAIAFERDDTRVVLCGVDIVGIIHPEIEPLLTRVSAATGADPAGILLNWSHTHLAPPGGVLNGAVYGDVDDWLAESITSFSRVIHDKIVSVCRMAVERLEPAEVRRERERRRLTDVADAEREQEARQRRVLAAFECLDEIGGRLRAHAL